MSPTGKKPVNVAASVRARLLNLARERKVEFQLMLSEFAVERLLFRLGVSRHAENFVLKGAMLLRLWLENRQRATWDIDLLGRGADGVADIVAIVRDLCSIPVDDGIVFDIDSITGEEIRVGKEYAGVRVRLEARLTEARIPMQIDVGFGDSLVPAASREIYPTLLNHPPPNILTYRREVVVAEKLEAMISLGVTNSRMKDFHDIHILASSFTFEGPVLVEAIHATFKRRGTPFPDTVPLALTQEFLSAPRRRAQWRAFLRRGRLDGPPDAGELAHSLRTFLWPILKAASSGDSFTATWPPGGPWG